MEFSMDKKPNTEAPKPKTNEFTWPSAFALVGVLAVLLTFILLLVKL